MVRIAVLSEQVSAQIRVAAFERPRELDNVEVVWSGTSIEDLRRLGRHLRPQVLVVDMALLGSRADVRSELTELLQSTEAELALILYSFTRRELVTQLNSTRSRALKAPISLATLRLNMLSFLVKDTLRPAVEASAAPELRSPGNASSPRPVRPEPQGSKDPGVLALAEGPAEALPTPGMPRLFTQAQLGRLQETQSAVRCECPNHLSELVTSLAAFEEYSRSCQNTNSEDAKVHAHLYEQTSRARRLMEQALLTLCKYERIEL